MIARVCVCVCVCVCITWFCRWFASDSVCGCVCVCVLPGATAGLLVTGGATGALASDCGGLGVEDAKEKGEGVSSPENLNRQTDTERRTQRFEEQFTTVNRLNIQQLIVLVTFSWN